MTDNALCVVHSQIYCTDEKSNMDKRGHGEHSRYSARARDPANAY